MTQRVVLEPAIVLHTRAYSNSSLIVELFTRHQGRVSVMARSARGPKSRYKGMLQLFSPLLVSWSGRAELKSLNTVERNGALYPLEGRALICAFYLNELLMHLLHREDACPIIFNLYQETLQKLAEGMTAAPVLRRFEKRLLHALGYALPLAREAETGAAIRSEAFYRYLPDRGFLIGLDVPEDAGYYSGRCLLALAQEQFDNDDVLKEAKHLLQSALSRHLGHKTIKSRELFT